MAALTPGAAVTCPFACKTPRGAGRTAFHHGADAGERSRGRVVGDQLNATVALLQALCGDGRGRWSPWREAAAAIGAMACRLTAPSG